MDSQKMFGFDEIEQQVPEMSGVEIDADAGELHEKNHIGDLSSAGEPQRPDGTEVPESSLRRLASTPPVGEAVGVHKHVTVKETHSTYEATGIYGEFGLSRLAQIFPLSPEDLSDLAADIESHGLIEEITLARTQGPESPLQIIDGRRRLQACEIAGVQPRYRILRDGMDCGNYIWSRNSERRHLTSSQRALAYAELFPSAGPGRPPRAIGNCAISDNLPGPTQGQAASRLGVSRSLINDAYKVANPDGRTAPEVREAVRQGVISLSDAVKDNVNDAPKEVQAEALALLTGEGVRTLTAAVGRVRRERQARAPALRSPSPTRVEKHEFYFSDVELLTLRLRPGTVDVLLVYSYQFRRSDFLSQIARLADRVLHQAGVLVLVVKPDIELHDVLVRLSRRVRETKFIAEFSLLFPLPIDDLGYPHQTEIRRVALLVFGKPEVRLPDGDDVIEVPAPAESTEDDDFMEIKDGLALVVDQFATKGDRICIPTLEGNSEAVLAAVKSGCTVVGAEIDEEVIADVAEDVLAFLNGSPATEPDAP